jgi:Nitrous oxide-stimulated promoter
MSPASTPRPDSAAERRAARLRTPRLAREQATLAAMMGIYCRAHHAVEPARQEQGLCDECAGLLEYARKRLAGCPFGPDKPTCVNCQIHCYAPAQREATRQVMRFAGPRMLLRHPLLALAHVVDGRRPAPPRPRPAGAAAAPPDPGE